MLTKQQVLESRRKTKSITIEDWGGEIFLRRLSLQQVDYLRGLSMDTTEAKVSAIMASVVTESGSPLFTTDEDRAFLVDQDHTVIKCLFDAINEFNGFTAPVEVAEKNFEPNPNDSSAIN